MNINQRDGDGDVSILPKKMAVKLITQVIRSVMDPWVKMAMNLTTQAISSIMDQMPVNLITQAISSVMGPKVKMLVKLITRCDDVHHGSIE